MKTDTVHIRYCESIVPSRSDLAVAVLENQDVKVLDVSPHGPDLKYTYVLVTR